jgi:hypothetical protein
MLLRINGSNVELAYPLLGSLEAHVDLSTDRMFAAFDDSREREKMGGALALLLVFWFPHFVGFFGRILRRPKPRVRVYVILSLALFPLAFSALGAEVFQFSKATLIAFIVCLSTWRYSKIVSNGQ